MMRGAGVLAHRQHAAGGDVGVLQKVVGDELVVVGRLGVVEDLCELRQMRRAQQMVDVGHRRFGQRAHRFAARTTRMSSPELLDAHALVGQLAIGRLVLAERKQRSIGGHGGDPGSGELAAL